MGIYFSDHLCELMLIKQISTYMLAKRSGVSRSTIMKYTHRQACPTLETFEMICKGLDVSVIEFLAPYQVVS